MKAQVRVGLTSVLFFFLALTLSACGENKKAEAIKIGEEVITLNGTPAKAAVVAEFLASKKKIVSKLSKEFAAHFTGAFTLDNSKKNSIGQLSVPALMHNGQDLYANHSIPDKINDGPDGGVATVFVKSGDDFVRIATSLKKEDGSRSFGTTLDRKHPGYEGALVGKPYSGIANLFGMTYLTEYTPIKDASGKVVGMLFVGLNITADILPLKAQLR